MLRRFVSQFLSILHVDGVSGLHTFIMASILKNGGPKLNLAFAFGRVLVFKSTRFDLGGNVVQGEAYIDIQHSNGDIPLRITFRRGQQKIFFNDCAFASLQDGWGKEQSAELGSVYDDRLKYSGVTITVHRPGPNRYQILLGLTTVGYFDSRFPGISTNIGYTESLKKIVVLSPKLEVFHHRISDLQPEERQAIESGR